MVYNPAQPIAVRVEANIAGLGWVDVTSRGRAASCVIRQGRSGNAIQAESARLALTLGNDDGWLTEGNAVSPWYPSWGRGCEIRVSRLGLTVSPAQRFHGRIDTLEAVYPGGRSSTVEITAVGTLGTLAQNEEPLRSAIYRTVSGTAPDDYRPHVYWPMEDGSDATQIAAATAVGSPVSIGTAANPGSDSSLVGSSPLPALQAGASLSFVIPPYVSQGQCVAQFAMKIPSEPAAEMTVAEFRMSSGPVQKYRITCAPGSPSQIRLYEFDGGGTSLGSINYALDGSSQNSRPAEANFYGHWAVFTLAPVQAGSDVTTWFGFTVDPATGGVTGGSTWAGTLGQLTSAKFFGGESGIGIGHLVVYDDPAFSPSIDAINNSAAMFGYRGEKAGYRMARLCHEEGIPFELVTDANATMVAMGPQPMDTLIGLLRDCEATDQGLMHDNGTDGAIVYVTRAHLYNQAATLAVVKGALEPNLRPVWDRLYATNDVTSTRQDGSSAHVSDEAHVAKVNARLKGDRRPNVATDAQLRHDAGWAVHLGTTDGPRYNSVGINLRNADGALLSDQVAAHAIGDRLTVAAAALPSQHPIDGIDGLTVGWTEVLDVDTWLFRPNVMPYAPYQVGVYGDTVKRYDSKYTTLIEDLDTTETTVDVITAQDRVLWVTGSAAPVFPFDVGVGGEKLSVSAIASLLSDTFTRSASNGWGTAPTGQSYTVSGTASEYSVTGALGRMALVTTNDLHIARADIGSADVLLVASVSVPVVPGGANITARLAGRLADTSNYYEAQISIATTGVVTLQMFKRVAGAGSAVTSSPTSFVAGTHSAGNTWWIKLSIFGTSLKAKAWKSTATEPRHWQITGTDSSLSTGTQIAALARRETGNTDGTQNVDFDNLQTLTPQRFTVARSRNGVVKTHAAGAKVSLWTPADYAY